MRGHSWARGVGLLVLGGLRRGLGIRFGLGLGVRFGLRLLVWLVLGGSRFGRRHGATP